jgi:hypothetical protein
MNELLKKFQESSGVKKVLLAILALVALLVAITIIVFIFAAVFGMTAFSTVSKNVNQFAYEVSGNGSVSVAPSYGGGTSAYKRISLDESATRDAADYYAPTVMPIPGTPASTGSLPAEKKVIRNGSLSMQVDKAEESAGAIQAIAGKYGGFVENSNIYEVSDGVKSGSVVVRVPENKFDSAMADIKKLALKVTNDNVSSSDVTAQFVDLEASLKNMKAEEAQYREIMAKAVKIQDILDVSSRLADVRGRIERTQGQMNYLSRQVAMSTISVYLTAQAEVEVFGIVWRPLTVLKQATKNLVSDLAGFVDYLIYLVFKLPVFALRLALFGFILWIIWKIGKWGKSRLMPN